MRGALPAMMLGLPVVAAPRILIVTATAGFRHESIETAEGVVAQLAGHPPDDEATIIVADATHAAAKALPSPHVMLEEIYSFTNHKPLFVRPLLTLAPHGAPLAWEKSYSRGRVLYTALGHREDVWRSSWFASFVGGAIEWALERRVELPRRRAVRP